MRTAMSKFCAIFCVIGRRFENHVPISLVLRRSCCSESACLLRAGVLLQSNRWAHRPDLLSVFVRLESVWPLAEGLLIVISLLLDFCKIRFGWECWHFKKPMHFLLFWSGRRRFPYFKAGQLIALLNELLDSLHGGRDGLLLWKCSVSFGFKKVWSFHH